MMPLPSTKQKLLVAILSCLLFVTFSHKSRAQLFHFNAVKISSETGLGTLTSKAAIKDADGFLWVMAQNKVQRYDGRYTKDFFPQSHNEPLLGIAADKQKRIWVVSKKALFYYSKQKKAFVTYNEALQNAGNYVNLLTTTAGEVFLLTVNALFVLNESNSSFEPVLKGKFLLQQSSYFPVAVLAKQLYWASPTAVYRYNTNSKKLDSVTMPFVRTLVCASADSLWAGNADLETSLISFPAQTITPLAKGAFAPLPSSAKPFIGGGIAVDERYILVHVRYTGFFLYDRVTKHFQKTEIDYAGNPLYAGETFQNAAGASISNGGYINLTYGLFFLSLKEEPIRYFTTKLETGLSEAGNEVRNFTELPAGTIWMATPNGIVKWNRFTNEIKKYLPKAGAKNYLNFPSVRVVAAQAGNIVVAQSEGGGWLFNPFNETFSPLQFNNDAAGDSAKQWMSNDFLYNYCNLYNGDILLAATRYVYRVRKQDHKVSVVFFNNKESLPLTRVIYEDVAKRIWFMYRDGCVIADSAFNILHRLQNTPQLSFNVFAIAQVNDSTFWLARDGITEIQIKGKGISDPRKIWKQLPRQTFYNLITDKNGFVWAAGEKGIYRLESNGVSHRWFSQSDNVQNQRYTPGQAFRSSDSAVFFKGYNGVNYLYPERFANQTEQLSCIITDIQINGNDSLLPQLKNNRLRYFQNSVQIHFIAPYVNEGQRVTYRYRMQGLSNNWVDAGTNTSVFFSELKPGSYQFNVAASVNGYDWTETSETFAFTITPPLWSRWWFRLLLSAALLAAGILYFRRRIQIVKETETRKTELERLKAESYQYRLEIEQVTNFFAQAIDRQNSVNDLLWDVSKNCISKLGFEDCVIYTKDAQRNVLVQQAAWGPKTTDENKIKNPIEIPMGKGIVGAAAQSGKPELINDTSADARYIVDDAMRFSELAVPIIKDNQVIGVIDSEHMQKGFYTQRHLQILTTIAAMLGDKIGRLEEQQQTREKETEVLRLNKDLATSQLTALRSQMNPHFLFNAMNSIQQFTLSGDTENANRYISKFSTLLRKVLHSSQQNYLKLDEEVEQLRLYLDIEQLRMGPDFSYEIKIDEEIEADACKIPGMLIQPFAENALKHGLSLKEGDKKLYIEFQWYSEREILVTITDNGIGRKQAAAIKAGQEKLLPHASKGIELIENRLQLLNLADDKELLAIIDLTLPDGSPGGTTVQLRLPLYASST
jgi:putative methionine-R-sulfoxide reductase with GAF domain/ligand-binding sensor domain-containing protein